MLSRQNQPPSPFLSNSGLRPSLSFPTTALEAQRLEKAVLTYDFIYLMIGGLATLLFIFETLWRVYSLYLTTNGKRSLIKRKRRKKRRISSTYCDELCQRISSDIKTCHDLYC